MPKEGSEGNVYSGGHFFPAQAIVMHPMGIHYGLAPGRVDCRIASSVTFIMLRGV